MSQENVEVVERAIAALNERDIDRYLGCCTQDIEVQTPWADIGGVYEGSAAIRRLLADIEDAGPDFRLEIERLESIGVDQVLGFLRATASGRASGAAIVDDLPTANIYDFADGKIRRIRIFRDRQEALEAVGLSE
jgi:ketosteroid isomerase-like protein